jgi:glycine/D-amino acid oxidase-like deaminating enzyme
MSAQTPGDRFESQATKHSWLFNYETGFDYLTQLPPGPHSTNEMMFGGGFAQGEYGGITDLGVATDDQMSLYADIHLSGALSAVFGWENWGSVSGPAVKNMWAGNMGFSADGFPWVGRLPESATGRSVSSSHCKGHGKAEENTSRSDGEWICAAFSGEGMVHAWRCGTALATMVLQSEGVNSDTSLDWFPEQMLVTEKRIKESVLPIIIPNIAKEDLELEEWVRLSPPIPSVDKSPMS